MSNEAKSKLPLDVSRCGQHTCNKRNTCLRYTDVNLPIAYLWSIFTVRDCQHYIGE